MFYNLAWFLQLSDQAQAELPIVEINVPGSSGTEPGVVACTLTAGSDLVVPVRLKLQVQTHLEEVASSLQDCMLRLPAPSLIAQVVVFPTELAPNRQVVEMVEKNQVGLSIPYTGVSLLCDITDCWAEALETTCVIERYLMELAFLLQAALPAEHIRYATASGAWYSLCPRLALDELSETDYETQPLISLIIASAIARACRREVDRDLLTEERFDKFEQRRKVIARVVNERVFPLLVKLIGDHDNESIREACTKILIHLADVPLLEKIQSVRELSFIGEPVGVGVVQRLKYISSLESLDLSESYFPAEAVNHLVHLPKLRSLCLRKTSAANTSIINLIDCPSLEELDCSYTAVNDDGVRHLKSFKKLKRVKLTGTRASAGLVVALRASGLEVSP